MMPFRLKPPEDDPQPQKSKAIPEMSRLYKSKRWRLIRNEVINNNPFCEICKLAFSVDCDHIEPWWINGKFWPEQGARYQALCKSCHSTKTKKEQG